MKRILSILTAVVLCVCMFTTTLSATEPVDSTGIATAFTGFKTVNTTAKITNWSYQRIGMYPGTNSTYTLKAGSLISTCLYGMYITGGSTVTILGCNFTDNYVGVYINGTGVTFTLEGEVVISGNAYPSGNETVDCNVYLDSGALITLGELSTGSSIGITTDTDPTVNSPVQITTAEAGGSTEYYKTAVQYFFSDDPRYTVTVNEAGGYLELSVAYFDLNIDTSIENGTITLLGSTTAAAGETVSFTVEPDGGYELSELTVTGTNGAIAVTENNGVYSFEMPVGAVTISALFSRSASNTSGIIYINELYHGIFIDGRLVSMPHTVNDDGYCTVCGEYIGLDAEEVETVEETVEIDEPVEGINTDTEIDG